MFKPNKRVLVTGAGGQLGRELAENSTPGIEVVALDRTQCDIEDIDQLEGVFRNVRPHAVINSAAYTTVDKAEAEPERAYAINATGAGNVARAALAVGSRLVHVSTDYVFDGLRSSPYSTEAIPNPVNVYGASKLAGEKAVIASGVQAAIVRTAWLFSSSRRNFLTTILEQIQSGRDLKIVCDQIGSPTLASGLSKVLMRIAFDTSVHGVVHWANVGAASWYDFAVTAQRLALDRSVVKKEVAITPILTKDYSTAARRPAYAVLDCSHLWSAYGPPESWPDALAQALDGVGKAAVGSP
jgi:dTDP-4-dehydrorhamnose reductase